MTTQEKPNHATHWSLHPLAKATGLSTFAVWTIWKANGLKPHLVRTFKVSKDPQFSAKVEDIVGLYPNPPEHAVVFSLDEKTQIQALDRTQPGLPLKRGRCGTMTHDYKRYGTTTLFAALNTLDGTVIGDMMSVSFATSARTAFAVGSSAAWTSWRRRSATTSPSTTPNPSHSFGPPPMPTSWAKLPEPRRPCLACRRIEHLQDWFRSRLRTSRWMPPSFRGQAQKLSNSPTSLPERRR